MAACEKHRKTPAKGYSPCPGCEVERLQAQARHEADCAEAYKAEAAHWKNNHETEVRRARALKERTDMPLERVEAYEKWGEDMRDAARYRWLRTNALDCQDTNGLEIVRLIPAHRSPNYADIDTAIDAAMAAAMPAND